MFLLLHSIKLFHQYKLLLHWAWNTYTLHSHFTSKIQTVELSSSWNNSDKSTTVSYLTHGTTVFLLTKIIKRSTQEVYQKMCFCFQWFSNKRLEPGTTTQCGLMWKARWRQRLQHILCSLCTLLTCMRKRSQCVHVLCMCVFICITENALALFISTWQDCMNCKSDEKYHSCCLPLWPPYFFPLY